MSSAIYHHGGASGKEPSCQCRRQKRLGLDPWLGKIPWRRKWQPTPALLPGESHGQRSLVGYSPWGRKELDMTEWLSVDARKPPPPPSPNKVTCWGTGWLGLEHRNLGGEYSSPHSQHRLLSPILEMCLVVCSLMGRQWRRDCDRATLWWQGCQGPPLRLSSATAPNGCPYDPLSSLQKPFNYIQ